MENVKPKLFMNYTDVLYHGILETLVKHALACYLDFLLLCWKKPVLIT